MRRRDANEKPYRICAAFDTETCNYGEGVETRAYVVCYQANDLRGVEIDSYELGASDDIRIFRHAPEMLSYVAELAEWGRVEGVIPVVCAYNLMFDLRSIIFELNRAYKLVVNAQTSTNVYTLDLNDHGETLLRFWDTFHLDMRGLAAMGEVAGVPKALGDWDYSLVRTPETPLTDEELFYATRDVQIIPAYLRYLCDANEWLKPGMLGCKVITKTSVVRQMAHARIGTIKRGRQNLYGLYLMTCRHEAARTFRSYALRKGCFRGGLSFTAMATASKVVRNVVSVDVTSMHHTFICSWQPRGFVDAPKDALQSSCEEICNVRPVTVLRNYHKPFNRAIHACVSFTNLRLKAGSCFEAWGIGLLARGKFGANVPHSGEGFGNEAAHAQERYTRLGGWCDYAERPTFAFSKLIAAARADVFVSEYELWCMAQVYEWDSMTALFGEISHRWEAPPDYVTLQTSTLFEQKSELKALVMSYDEEPFPFESRTLPESIVEEVNAGTMSNAFLSSYYGSTVKGMFNSIYGTQAQDVYKPGFTVDPFANVMVNRSELCTEETWDERQPKCNKVLYTYGMRIVGRSRTHLILAMQCLYETLGDKVAVLGGDTDSLKISCADGVTDDDIDAALKPMADAADLCINAACARVRRDFPELSSDLAHVGHYEIENRGHWYPWHMELWPKCRVSYDGRKFHVTCAGLSRPKGSYTIEDYMLDYAQSHTVARTMRDCIGYNVYVPHDVSHALERTSPSTSARFVDDVTDYRGVTAHVDAPEVFALYPVGRMLGDTSKQVNFENVSYLQSQGRTPRVGYKELS